MASGYGQDMLDSPVAQTMDQHDLVSQVYKPAELKNDPGVKEFRANLKKYAGFTDVPDYGLYTGYIDCDLAIKGLEQSGKNLTGQGFVDGLHKLGTYNPANLECAADRHQPHELRQVACHQLRLLHVRQGREVRRDEQGQAGHGQARR